MIVLLLLSWIENFGDSLLWCGLFVSMLSSGMVSVWLLMSVVGLCLVSGLSSMLWMLLFVVSVVVLVVVLLVFVCGLSFVLSSVWVNVLVVLL